jgi:hypothetical protein
MKDERGAQKGRCFLGRVIREKAWKVIKPKRADAPDPDESQGSKIRGTAFQVG